MIQKISKALQSKFASLGKEMVMTYEDLISDVSDEINPDMFNGSYYREINIAYDSETVEIDIDENHRYSTQVCHQLCVEDKGIMVRTVDDFIELLDFLADHLCYKKKRRGKEIPVKIVIYVHNLDYDLTFLLYKLIKERTSEFTIKRSYSMFEYRGCIQFKDSANLFGHSLDESIKEFLGKDSIFAKRYGMWNYDEIRSPLYKLSDDEIEYAMIDVFALIEVLRVVKKNNKCTIASLPVSTSSFVGRMMTEHLLDDKRSYKAMNEIAQSFYDSVHECNLDRELLAFAKECYYGGISFTNPVYTNKYIRNIGDQDMGSQYPTALCTQLFPYTTPKKNTKIKTFEELDNWIAYTNDTFSERGGFLAKIRFKDIESKQEYPIPNIVDYENVKHNKINGRKILHTGPRIYYAETLEVYMSDVDYKIIRQVYNFEDYEILELYTYRMKPLPTPLVHLILSKYGDKTYLKGVKGKDVAYMDAKIFVNTIYGLMGMYPLHDNYEIDYMGEIHTKKLTDDEIDATLAKYNSKVTRTTFYLWGVYTAAYGHMFLYRAMKIVGTDLAFCDTDSVKYDNKEKYVKAFEDMNVQNEEWLRFVGHEWHGWNESTTENLFFPKTQKGVVKPLGNWESEEYDKDLGELIGAISKRSKCYVMKYKGDDGKIDYRFTVAGIAKQDILNYARKLVELNIYKNIEEFFIDDPEIPGEYTHKLTHQKNFMQPMYKYTDSQGNKWVMDNPTAVYLFPASFSLNSQDVDDQIIDLLLNGVSYKSVGVY